MLNVTTHVIIIVYINLMSSKCSAFMYTYNIRQYENIYGNQFYTDSCQSVVFAITTSIVLSVNR